MSDHESELKSQLSKCEEAYHNVGELNDQLRKAMVELAEAGEHALVHSHWWEDELRKALIKAYKLLEGSK